MNLADKSLVFLRTVPGGYYPQSAGGEIYPRDLDLRKSFHGDVD
jgi:hypothetical protein